MPTVISSLPLSSPSYLTYLNISRFGLLATLPSTASFHLLMSSIMNHWHDSWLDTYLQLLFHSLKICPLKTHQVVCVIPALVMSLYSLGSFGEHPSLGYKNHTQWCVIRSPPTHSRWPASFLAYLLLTTGQCWTAVYGCPPYMALLSWDFYCYWGSQPDLIPSLHTLRKRGC